MFKMRYQMIRYLSVEVNLRTANIPLEPQKYRFTVISIVVFFKSFNSRKTLKGYKKSKVMKIDSPQTKFRTSRE